MKKTLITSMLTAALFMLFSFSNATTLNSAVGGSTYSTISNATDSNSSLVAKSGWTGYAAGTKAGNTVGRVANRVIAAAELLYGVYLAVTSQVTLPESSNSVQNINYNASDLSEFN